MHAKSDSEVTSIAPSSPTRSPRRPLYFVQSPSRDSHDGEKMSFQSTPILSPMGSPSHPSMGRHSRESSASRFSGTLKPGTRKVLPHDQRHGKNDKGWPQCHVIQEEGQFDDLEGRKNLPRRCYVVLFVLCFAVLFAIFSLVLWGASRPYKPQISMKSITFRSFYVAEGSDATGVPTKMISLNSTVKLSVYNPASFFGIHVTSTPVDLMYNAFTVATGQLREYYQSRKSHRTVSIVVEGKKIPLYGAGSSLSSSDATQALPLELVFAIRSRAYVLGKLVKPKFRKHIHCKFELDSNKMKPIRSLHKDCQID
eukprot:Gb_00802 [translate_table: standard]